jgi:hypothetical protein
MTPRTRPIHEDPEFIPLRKGERLTPEQVKTLFPHAQAVLQKIAQRVLEMQLDKQEQTS